MDLALSSVQQKLFFWKDECYSSMTFPVFSISEQFPSYNKQLEHRMGHSIFHNLTQILNGIWTQFCEWQHQKHFSKETKEATDQSL